MSGKKEKAARRLNGERFFFGKEKRPVVKRTCNRCPVSADYEAHITKMDGTCIVIDVCLDCMQRGAQIATVQGKQAALEWLGVK